MTRPDQYIRVSMTEEEMLINLALTFEDYLKSNLSDAILKETILIFLQQFVPILITSKFLISKKNGNIKSIRIYQEHEELKDGQEILYLDDILSIINDRELKGAYKQLCQKLVKAIQDKNQNISESALLLDVLNRGVIMPIKAIFGAQILDINITFNHNTTPLHIASKKGDYEIVQFLLKVPGINVNAINDEGMTALSMASCNGHTRIVKALLIIKRTDVNIANIWGATALHMAVQSRHQQVVEILLTRPTTDINAATNDGATALHMASQDNTYEIVEILLQNTKIRVNAKTKHGATALYVASQHGYEQTVKILLKAKKIEVNDVDNEGITALCVASQFDCKGVIEILLDDKRVNPNIVTHSGVTALHIAIHNHHWPVVRTLIIAPNIDVNIADPNGVTALHIASQEDPQTAQELLKKPRINFNAATKEGITALHITSQNGSYEATQSLLQMPKIDVNAAGIGKITALHLASQNGHQPIVEILLKVEGINVNAITVEGVTALFIASQHNHKKVVETLLKATEIDVNVTVFNGYTALFVASQENHLEIVKLLLMAGANVDVQEYSYLNTSLHLAVMLDNFEMVKLLLQKNARLDLKNVYGLTAANLVNPYAKNGIKIINLFKANQRFNQIRKQIISTIEDQQVNTNDIIFSLDKYGEKTGVVITISCSQTSNQTTITFPPDCSIINVINDHKLLIGQLLPIQSSTTQSPAIDQLLELIKPVSSQIEELSRLQDKFTELKLKISDYLSEINKLLPKKKVATIHAKTTSSNIINWQDMPISISPDLISNIQLIDTDINNSNLNIDKKITLIQKFFTFKSVLLNMILQEERKLNNPIRIDKSQKLTSNNNIKKKDEEIRGAIDKVSSMITNVEEPIITVLISLFEELNKSFDSFKSDIDLGIDIIKSKIDQLESLSSNLSNIYKISLRYNKILQPKISPQPISAAKLTDIAYIPQSTDSVKILAQIFLTTNINRYDPAQLNNIAKIIRLIDDDQLDEFLRFSSINMVKSENIAITFCKSQKLIKAIAAERREKFRHYLYQSHNLYNNGSIDTQSLFLVIVEDLFYQLDEELKLDQIYELAKSKELLVTTTSTASNLTLAKKIAQDQTTKTIIKLLEQLINNQQFLIILHYAPHGKQTENPHIEKSPLKLLQKNFATTEAQLRDIFGNDLKISQTLLDKIIDIISRDFFDNLQKRFGGSHNIGFRIPKILPNQKSHLSNEENFFYKQQLKNLTTEITRLEISKQGANCYQK